MVSLGCVVCMGSPIVVSVETIKGDDNVCVLIEESRGKKENEEVRK